jgi:hypothetical protein
MTPRTLLARLRASGITVTAAPDGQLHLDGDDATALSPELEAELHLHRAEVRALLDPRAPRPREKHPPPSQLSIVVKGTEVESTPDAAPPPLTPDQLASAQAAADPASPGLLEKIVGWGILVGAIALVGIAAWAGRGAARPADGRRPEAPPPYGAWWGAIDGPLPGVWPGG